MELVIKETLEEIEKKHQVTILFACESGSRAWGFPSPDSDYDVRFVYLHHTDWYISLRERDEVVELPVNAVLDINGWDFKKALRLLLKSNVILYEWLQSPVIYKGDEVWIKDFYQVAQSAFSPIAAMHHYLSMARKHVEECANTEEVKLKKYFYALRATLASEWIAQRKEVPPMELKKLMALIQDQDKVILKIDELQVLKSIRTEAYFHQREGVLDDYLREAIARCEAVANSLPGKKDNYDLLDTFYRRVIYRKA